MRSSIHEHVSDDCFRLIISPGIDGGLVCSSSQGEKVCIRSAEFLQIDDPGKKTYRFTIIFEADPDEKIYGLGLHEEDIFNYRGHRQYLIPANMKIPVPVLISSRKYACLFNHGCAMIFDDSSEGMKIVGECAEKIDLYIIFAENFDDIIRKVRRITGKASMLPRWAFGYWQSKEHYSSADELIDIVSEYRQRQIPIDCIVQDWLYWPEGQWGQKSFDPVRYPDPDKFIAILHALGVKIMISVWPNMAECNDLKELSDANCMMADGATYNAFDPQAGRIFWRQICKGLYRYGIDALWCDSTEPFSDIEWEGTVKRAPADRYALLLDNYIKFIKPDQTNMYAYHNSANIYEGQSRSYPSKRAVHLTRSGYIGQQKFGAIVWTGDVSAKWSVLRSNITNMIQFSMTGHPYVTFDIGGFFAGNLNCYQKRTGMTDRAAPWYWNGDYEEGYHDKGYCELYLRWLQAGVFMPVFRSHGSDTPREAWRFAEHGAEFYGHIVAAIRMRYMILPYLYSIAAEVHANDYSFLRPLFFEFPEDHKAYDISDQFFLGPSLMVCPVTEAMYYGPGSQALSGTAFTRKVYLPVGSDWYDFRTGDKYRGGTMIDADAKIDRIPVFVKAGAILPICRNEVANTYDHKLLALLVYPGKDCTFRYYDDNGDGEFDVGGFTEIRWIDGIRRIENSAGFDEVVIVQAGKMPPSLFAFNVPTLLIAS